MRFALGLQYNGVAFKGWQRQTRRDSKVVAENTVQHVLESALSKVASEPIITVVAGRTDAGVHACTQVVHFDCTALRPLQAWLAGTNSLLPATIRVLWAKEVPLSFHARFSATARRYRYLIHNTNHANAFCYQLCHQVPMPLCERAMSAAARHLIGTHNFSSFRAAGCQATNAVRHIFFARIRREGDWVIFDIQANAFLQHMVRNIVGSLLEVGLKKQEPAWIAELLSYEDRRRAASCAPPHGLYLWRIRYDAVHGLRDVSANTMPILEVAKTKK